MNQSVIVTGAGISGLVAAYFLKKQGMNVLVLERDNEVGGTMKTIHEDGWLIETGPNSALATTPLFAQLFDELGIRDEVVYGNELANNRYILRDGVLHSLPMSPPAFLKTKLFSWSAKLRLLKEPFVGRATKEESIAEFVERRLGREFLDYAINPFVAGVYAGNPEQLSVRHAFPKLYALEEKYGGLIKGMIGSRKERKARKEVAKDRAKLFSFKNGMETLPKALATYLGDSVQLGCSVEHIIPMKVGKYPIYHVSYKQGDTKTTLETKVVVLASPASATANIIRPIDPEFAATLESIYYPPVTVAFMGFRKEQIKRELDGFGFLIPAKEQRKILGSLWSSTLFANRAPDGHVALTTFLGGARSPELTAKSRESKTEVILSELHDILGIDGAPVFTKLFHWEKAIPQYNLGYGKVLNAIERFEANFRGAFICSNYRGGISVGDCVMSGEKTALGIIGMIGKD
ncbi:MAG: protoporphyrinogen oxidase [Ignavibacteriae bacterium]|nr:protoporphyrinogen oxidase [Ignavibacteriota bacterium]